ncbi:MAG: hypothetical protein QG609_264 [Patescibacteria group bacterium]|nr:hypothetical protein [Patescibacteria group bacterium]
MEKLKIRAYNTLRWSEKYTKTDMLYLAKGGFWLSLNQAISTIASLILLISFANFISAETYGNYRYILSVIGILVIGTFPGINTIAIKAVAEAKESIFWHLVYKKSYLTLISSLLCFIASTYYYLNDNQTLALSFIIAGIGIPFSYTFGMYESLILGRKDFKTMYKINSLSKIITTISTISTIYLTDNILALVTAYFVPQIIIQGIFLIYFYLNKVPQTIDGEYGKKLTNFGYHLSFMEILKTIAGQIDKLLIFHYLGAGQLALYAIATAPPGQIKTILQNLTTLATPKMSTSKADDIKNTLLNKLFRLEIIMVFCVVAYWVITPFIFPIFFPKYTEAILISQVYALSLLFFPRTFLSTAMTAHLKQKELYFIRIFAPSARIIIFFIALPLWGIWGAVIGSIASNLATTLIYQYYFKKAFA